jgi:hypothetical protein
MEIRAMHPWLVRIAASFLAILLFGSVSADCLPAQDRSQPPVPQEFEWWKERGIPATTPWGQAVDTTATRMMLSWTTAPEFTNPHVDHLPHHPTVVSPMDHWGYPSGRVGKLHRVDELYSYYQALAASSPRVRMDWLGESEEGNPFAVVIVGSEANIARLDEIRRGYQRLTDPRSTSREEAERLIRELPVTHLVYSGLHSAETGHPEVTPELAYRLAVSEDPMLQRIREDAILFIMPVADPDGRNRMVDWYRLHEERIVSEHTRIPGPPFWGQYMFHDNNRDGLQLTLRLYQEAVDLYEAWKFPITIDLHESVPFLYVSSGHGPYNPRVPAVTRHEWQWVSHYEVSALTSLGMPGVWTHDFYDGWNPAYLFWIANNRNAIGRFYETYNHSVPIIMEQRVPPGRTSVEWFRANPPYSQVIWSIRNNINYAQTGVLHSLHLMATSRERVLRNFRTKHEEAVRLGRTAAPHAWVVPADQGRKANVSRMLQVLQRQGIEVHRADRAGSFGEGDGAVQVRSGDWVVRMDQPYRHFVLNLMERQDYPEDAPRPYDDVAWTFPLLYNVTVRQVDDPAVLALPMTRVTEPVHLPGTVRVAGRGAPEWWVARYDGSFQAIQARHELGDLEVWAARETVEIPGGGEFGPGAWLIPASAMERSAVEAWAARFGLEVVGVPGGAVSEVERHRQEFPRIALLHTWRRTQDDGSVRWALEDLGIPYTYFPEDRLREGNLRDRFDVILFPEQGARSSGRAIFEGRDPSDGPWAWQPHPDFPSLGAHSTTDDMTGGMGHDGLLALRDFVQEGGTLITLGSASTVPAEFGFVRGVGIRDAGGIFSPGSIVKGRIQAPSHPVTWGYDEEVPLFERFGPYLDVPGRLNDHVLLRYAPADELFMSGLVLGRDELAGRPALVSFPMGEGHLVMFGFRTMHRNNTRGLFAFVWNAVMNWNQLHVGLPAPAAVADDGDGHPLEGSQDR